MQADTFPRVSAYEGASLSETSAMLKPVMGLAATGIVALVLFKLFTLFILPLIIVAVGITAVIIKWGFILLMVWFAIWLFKKMTRSAETA